MSKPLPPLPTLEAFDAAARHQSFKEAAAELGLTPSAVSHRIKALEHFIGQPLFLRLNREIQLTREGKTYFRAIRRGFGQLTQATQKVKGANPQRELRISAVPIIANHWIIPRLNQFLAKRPGLGLRINASIRNVDFARGEADIAIRYGSGRWAGLSAIKLFDGSATPIYGPALIGGKIRNVEDLRAHTLIHLSVFPEGWPRWLAKAGNPNLKPKRELWVDSATSAIEAAERGLGVTLGLFPTIGSDVTNGKLLAPFPITIPVEHPYWIVCRRTDRHKPDIAAFIHWLVQSVSETLYQMK